LTAAARRAARDLRTRRSVDGTRGSRRFTPPPLHT
jgi:hypothetical protein